MREIEEELDDELHAILKRANWLNYTPLTRKQKEVKAKRTALYLFVI
ncbi:hypothetical protein [Domibacillus robiginosus]|nr:hypothetical protein [Domibacillus robiginosus]